MSTIIKIILVLFALGACSAEHERKAPASICKSLDGSDVFVLDPGHPETKASIGFDGASVEFVNLLTGYRRVVTGSMQSQYKCREYPTPPTEE